MDYERIASKIRAVMHNECIIKTININTVYQANSPLPRSKYSLFRGIPHTTITSLYNNVQQTPHKPVNLSPFTTPQSYGEATTAPLPCICGAPIDPGPMPYDPPKPIIG